MRMLRDVGKPGIKNLEEIRRIETVQENQGLPRYVYIRHITH